MRPRARASAAMCAGDLGLFGAAFEAQVAQALDRVVQAVQRAAPGVRRASDTVANWVKLAIVPSLLAGSADLFVQGAAAGDVATGIDQWDKQRTGAFAVFGFFYSGMFQRVLYKRYDAILGTGSCLITVTKKVLVDSTVHAPLVYLPIFYLSTGLMQSLSLEDSMERLQSNHAPAFQTYLLLWTPAMYFVFAFVPVPQRVLTVACFSWVEKAIYSWLDSRKVIA